MRIKTNYKNTFARLCYDSTEDFVQLIYCVFLPLGHTFLRADFYFGLCDVCHLCQLTSMFSSVHHVILGLGWNVNLLLA